MGEEVGGFVDYLTGANKNISEDAKIIFKLDRLVLDELTDDPVLSNYSCLVID
jgi:HrpA-like RNA helicase